MFTSDSKPSTTCAVFERLDGEGLDGSRALPLLVALTCPEPFSDEGCFGAAVFLGLAFGLDFDFGSNDSSSSEEDNSMTSSTAKACLPLACVRARERILARSAMSMLARSIISMPLSDARDVSEARTVVAVGGSDEEASGCTGGGGGGIE